MVFDIKPVYARTHDASDWDADDGAEINDRDDCMTNETTPGTGGPPFTTCIKVGKAPDDIMRFEFTEDKANLVSGDQVRTYATARHNYVTVALIPYDTAAGVTTSQKVTAAGQTDDWTTFTLSSGFISSLHDLGSGRWACRLVEDLEIDGDMTVIESHADLTTAAVGVSPGLRTHALTGAGI